MKIRIPVSACILIASMAGTLATLFIGCSQESAEVLIEVPMDAPAEFQDQKKTWVKTDIGSTDQDCLAKFFEQNQELVGSPDMEGEPVLFTSGKSDRRFYWLNTTIDGSRWLCVHFEKGRFATTEGVEIPF